MRRNTAITSLAAGLLILGSSLDAADFIRGDANGDGTVTPADAKLIINGLRNKYLAGDFSCETQAEIPCPASLDVDDSGCIDLLDAVTILASMYLGASPVPPPYPSPGPDPNPNGLGCQSYGGGSPLVDPAARIKVLDLVVPGGSQRSVLLNLAVSSTASTAGLSGNLAIQGNIMAASRDTARDLIGFSEQPFLRVAIVRTDGGVEFAYMSPDNPELPVVVIPAGEDLPVTSLPMCLKPGTPAGEYPITVISGELIDAASGRAIVPTFAGGTLRVLAAVTDSPCKLPPWNSPNVRFSLARASGAPGAKVDVPFSIRASVPSQGFAFSLDFDEGALAALEVEKLWQKPSGTPYEFEKFEINSEDENPGNAWLDEGYLVGAAVFSLTDSSDVLPPAEEVAVLNLRFQVRPRAPAGPTEIIFVDGGEGSGGPVFNKLIAGGKDITPGATGTFLFVNGVVNILPDGSIFVRGDSNGDGSVDISDPVATLDSLFLGGPQPRCEDAADANDDGAMDLTDAVATLDALFLDPEPLPAPYPDAGADPTADTLGCGSPGV